MWQSYEHTYSKQQRPVFLDKCHIIGVVRSNACYNGVYKPVLADKCVIIIMIIIIISYIYAEYLKLYIWNNPYI